MVKNKKGWIRIMEATIAVLLISSVLIVLYSKQPNRGIDAQEYVSSIQEEILKEIATKEEYRNEILGAEKIQLIPGIDVYETPTTITNYINTKIPVTLKATIKICDLTTPITPCKLNATQLAETGYGDVFVQEKIISANITEYEPKKVKLFIWENR